MAKLSNSTNEILPEFRKFILEKKLVPDKNVETTMIYTHVLRNMSNAPKSPLDSLYEKPESP